MGFDIDGRNSSSMDAEGCFHEDKVDPLGNEGIDNALSSIVPALEPTEAAAVEPAAPALPLAPLAAELCAKDGTDSDNTKAKVAKILKIRIS